MAEARKRKISRGSVTLQVLLEPRLETKKFAHDIGKGTDLVSRWATGDRQPIPKDRAVLETKVGIPWSDWDDLLTEEQAAQLAKELREASAEPASTFPVGDKPANGRAGHAA